MLKSKGKRLSGGALPGEGVPSPGDVENRKAAAVPRCFILQKKARLGRDGGSLRGEGEPFARQQKGSPSPLK